MLSAETSTAQNQVNAGTHPYTCARGRTTNITHTLRPCKVCASKLGEDLMPDMDESFDPASSSTSVNVTP